MAKTIQQLHDECVQAGWKPRKQTRGKGFKHEIARIDEARTWKVDDNYQRTISPNKLESYAVCDYDLLIPVIYHADHNSLRYYLKMESMLLTDRTKQFCLLAMQNMILLLKQ